eukprot:4875470-Ditylum_brightwellii.AAC.1
MDNGDERSIAFGGFCIINDVDEIIRYMLIGNLDSLGIASSLDKPVVNAIKLMHVLASPMYVRKTGISLAGGRFLTNKSLLVGTKESW